MILPAETDIPDSHIDDNDPTARRAQRARQAWMQILSNVSQDKEGLSATALAAHLALEQRWSTLAWLIKKACQHRLDQTIVLTLLEAFQSASWEQQQTAVTLDNHTLGLFDNYDVAVNNVPLLCVSIYLAKHDPEASLALLERYRDHPAYLHALHRAWDVALSSNLDLAKKIWTNQIVPHAGIWAHTWWIMAPVKKVTHADAHIMTMRHLDPAFLQWLQSVHDITPQQWKSVAVLIKDHQHLSEKMWLPFGQEHVLALRTSLERLLENPATQVHMANIADHLFHRCEFERLLCVDHEDDPLRIKSQAILDKAALEQHLSPSSSHRLSAPPKM